MSYKKIVDDIKTLPWHSFDPKSIIFLSWVTAIEFAESLRIALRMYTKHTALREMAEGELDTDNLVYEDYNKKGDHAAFLEHFIGKTVSVTDIAFELHQAREMYNQFMDNTLNNYARAMTVFSREQELPGIFETILKAHDWDSLGLGFYRYYLKRHIELDSVDGGHGDLTKDFALDADVLEKFYRHRLALYVPLYK